MNDISPTLTSYDTKESASFANLNVALAQVRFSKQILFFAILI